MPNPASPSHPFTLDEIERLATVHAPQCAVPACGSDFATLVCGRCDRETCAGHPEHACHEGEPPLMRPITYDQEHVRALVACRLAREAIAREAAVREELAAMKREAVQMADRLRSAQEKAADAAEVRAQSEARRGRLIELAGVALQAERDRAVVRSFVAAVAAHSEACEHEGAAGAAAVDAAAQCLDIAARALAQVAEGTPAPTPDGDVALRERLAGLVALQRTDARLRRLGAAPEALALLDRAAAAEAAVARLTALLGGGAT